MLRFAVGRNNLALTIFTPCDCENACPFCTSKKSYSEKTPDFYNVLRSMNKILYETSLPISDIVISGGEPMSDIDVLSEIISQADCFRHRVYINTTLVNRNLSKFIKLVNDSDVVRGINVSRHGETYEMDQLWFKDIAPDDALMDIHKPVRINCVVHDQDVGAVVNRWREKNVELSFRRDYRDVLNEHQLHSPYDPTAIQLIRFGFQYAGKTQCNVCDTTIFKMDDMTVRYHKGLERSSILQNGILEFNDIIIDQSGCVAYDWSGVNGFVMADLLEYYRLFYPARVRQSSFCGCSAPICGATPMSYCGGQGC